MEMEGRSEDALWRKREKWNEGENERENKEDRKGGPDVEYRFSSSVLFLSSRDEKAGRFGSREWIIINRYFRQSRPFILRHATPIIYRRFGEKEREIEI